MRKLLNRSDRKITCDVCGHTYRVSDVQKITDKYNRHFGLVVCKYDKDPTNAHDIPYKYSEIFLTAEDMVRPRPDRMYVTNEHDDRLPSKPLYGDAIKDPLQSYIYLTWEGPYDSGSSGIIGYKVQRASPQFTSYDTIIENTNESGTFYLDTTASLTAEYSYRVAAINSFGTGPYSDEFGWPILSAFSDINYLVLSQDGSVLTTSDTGYGIRLNYISYGVI